MHNNKIIFIALIVFLAVVMFNLPCFAQTTEQLDITTYYPSPTGVYQQLRLFPTDSIDPTQPCNKQGAMFYHLTNNALYVCDGTAWKQMSGPAQQGTPYGWVPIIDVYNSAVPPGNTCLAIGKVPCPDPDTTPYATTYLQNCLYRNTPHPTWGDMGSVSFCFQGSCGACSPGAVWACKGSSNGCGDMAIAVHCCNP